MNEVFHKDIEDNQESVIKKQVKDILNEEKELNNSEAEKISEEDEKNRILELQEEEKKIAEDFSNIGKLPPILLTKNKRSLDEDILDQRRFENIDEIEDLDQISKDFNNID